MSVWWNIIKLKWGNRKARARAAETLGSRFEDARAVEPLIAALRDCEGGSGPAEALTKLGWQPRDGQERVFYAIAQGNFGDVAKEGKAAVAPLLVWWGKAPNERAAEALRTIDDPRCVLPLVLWAQENANSSTRYTIECVVRILQRCAGDLETSILQVVARMKDAPWPGGAVIWACSNFDMGHELIPLDCSTLRQLARQELVRRGIRA
jgi:HEAT repeat protein